MCDWLDGVCWWLDVVGGGVVSAGNKSTHRDLFNKYMDNTVCVEVVVMRSLVLLTQVEKHR